MEAVTLRDQCGDGHEVVVTIDRDGGVKISCEVTDGQGQYHKIRLCDACKRKGESLARQYKARKTGSVPAASP